MRNSLILGITMQLQPEHVQRLNEIDVEDFSGVRRKVAEHFEELGRPVTDDFLDRGVHALKQYYAMIVLDPANIHAMSRQVDPFWHAHILHSKQYMDFCSRLIGEYIHHYPLNVHNEVQMGAIRPISDDTFTKIPMVFKNVDPEFWPKAFAGCEVICTDPCSQGYARNLHNIALFKPDPAMESLGATYRSAN